MQENATTASLQIDEYDASHDIIVGYGSPPTQLHYYGGDESLSPCPSLHEDDEEEHRHGVSHVEVELIQSTVLDARSQHHTNTDEDEVEYSVDEPSSDDEAP